ncbi:MAG: hypothetical protein ACE5IR_12360 [bacterium]
MTAFIEKRSDLKNLEQSLQTIQKLTGELSQSLQDGDFEQAFQTLETRDELFIKLNEESTPFAMHHKYQIRNRIELRIKKIRALDQKNLDFVKQRLESISKSMLGIEKSKQAVGNFQDISLIKRRPIVNFTH